MEEHGKLFAASNAWQETAHIEKCINSPSEHLKHLYLSRRQKNLWKFYPQLMRTLEDTLCLRAIKALAFALNSIRVGVEGPILCTTGPEAIKNLFLLVVWCSRSSAPLLYLPMIPQTHVPCCSFVLPAWISGGCLRMYIDCGLGSWSGHCFASSYMYVPGFFFQHCCFVCLACRSSSCNRHSGARGVILASSRKAYLLGNTCVFTEDGRERSHQ